MDGGAPPMDGGFDAPPPPLGGMEDAMPAAEPLPTFGEPEPLPTFGEPEPTPMPAMGGLGDEFAAPASLGPLATWRIEQQEKVAAKAAAAETALAAKLAEAQTKIQEFYAERATMAEKRAATNRSTEKSYIEDRDAAMVADSWASVCGLVDLSKQTEEKPKEVVFDTSRMRQVLVQLKHS